MLINRLNVTHNTLFYFHRLSPVFVAVSDMKYFSVALLAFLLFVLTCLLCVTAGFLLNFSPFFAIAFFLFGALAVVLMVDMLQAHLFQ